MKTQSVLKFQNVCKSYGTKKVFEDFNLDIDISEAQEVREAQTTLKHSSQIIALLGANGAGKTTLLKMLLGLEAPCRGHVRLYNQNPRYYKTRSCIGATPQELDFPEGLRVSEILRFVQNHYQHPLGTEKLLEVFQLSKFLTHKASSLSGGQKRRLALALAFIGNPSLVLLDEPTTGLDVIARKSFWHYIKYEACKTILLTTHDLSEIEKVATRLLFLHNGKIDFDGSVAEFKKIHSHSTRKISFYAENIATEKIKSIEYVKTVSMHENHFTIEVYESDECIRELVKHNIPFKNISIETSSLEESFLNVARK